MLAAGDAIIMTFAIFGAVIFIIAVSGYIVFLYGKIKTEKKVAENNLQALKSAGQTTEAIISKQRADYDTDSDPDKLLYKD